MKKLICLFVALLTLLPSITSCKHDEINEKDAEYIDDYEFIVKFGNDEIRVNQINSSPEGNNAVVYTRDYKLNEKYSMTIGESQNGRVAISVRCTSTKDGYEFDIVGRSEDIASAPIPVNGFALSVPSATLDSIRANVGQLIEVEGYERAVDKYERHDLATIAPDYLVSTASRRVSIVNPLSDFESNKIYLITSELAQSKPISIDNLVVTAKQNTNYSSSIISIEKKDEISVPSKDEVYFVFTGEYNIAYANHYLTNTDRISFSMIDKCNPYSDMPAIIVANNIIELNDENFNVSEIKEQGVYIFDDDFHASVTPEFSNNRKDIVVVNDYVALVGESGARSLIPDGNGFVITLVGEDNIKNYADLNLGEKVKTCYIEYAELPDRYINISDSYFSFNIVDAARSPEGVSVLYTSNYGATTNTNQYGSEIVITNGKVAEINIGMGNSKIPENGYVLSIHKDSDNYSNIKNIKIGDVANLNLNGSAYTVSELKVTGINQTRFEDALIVYRGTATTGTNPYGYEIAVDKNGIAVAAGHAGNIEIPTGGFVLSGHGVNKTALENAYAIGQRIVLAGNNKTVTIIKTPEHKLSTAKYSFTEISDKLDVAKSAYLNLDFNGLDEQLALLESIIEEAENSFDSFDFGSALSKAESVISTCENLQYALIESKGVENRAVWYRSVEKNDAEVKATVEKLKTLNVNAIYLETWYEGYCIGSKVDIEGIARNNGGFDALESFIRIGHEYGIEVHAWVHNFFVGFYYKNGPSYYNPIFDNYKSKYLLDRNGNDFFYYTANDNYFIFLNPYDRECRDLLLNIYEQLITKYDLDGLHLDYVRLPELNYGKDDFGYNDDIVNAFSKETGITKDPTTFVSGSVEMQKWVDFRCNIITSFVGEVYDMVRDINSDLWLSVATYPDLNMAKNSIFQDVETFIEKGYFDEIFSMSYGVDDASVMPGVYNYASITKDNVYYSAGIAAFMETIRINFAQQLANVTSAGSDGVSVFSLNSISPETYQLQMTDGAFRDPSIQVYKLSKTASAQMDYIIKKIDNISCLFKVISDDNITLIKQKCADIKAISDSFDMENASVSEKVSWCNKAIFEIRTARTEIINACGDNDETEAVISEFENLEYWLSISIKRLETRK